jgi:isocitrate lyase
VKDIAQEMLDLLSGEDKWMQDEYERLMYRQQGEYSFTFSHVSYCLLGAYGKITHDSAAYYATRMPRTAYIRRLAEIIREQYPERIADEMTVMNMVTSFNDHPETTYEDIRIVLEKSR